ncbi:MAG: hypothetical protein WD717_06065 [Nitrosarchaeum sp.]
MKFLKISIFVISLVVVFIAGWIIGNHSFFNTESKEIDCLRIYKDIRENLRTPERQLSEREAILKEKDLLIKYVENNCPDFPDLDIMYKQALKVKP